MAKTTTTTEVIYNQIFRTKSSALTNRINEIILKLVDIYVLELEDVLFHLNSCVIMPDNPKGKSSADGNMSETDEALDITGIRALAVVFKQFEFDPDVRMIITGHTDTSGEPDFNFKLSDERSKNVLHLLTGTREEWADLCYGRHKVEDCQQIMKYFDAKWNIGCDPGELNDKYNESTKNATKNFFVQLNPMTADANFAKVNNDYKKRWPKEIWGYVYDLYSKEMADMLEITVEELDNRRSTAISFIDDEKKYLGCGESFPIEDKEKKNYRSQRNRRVELLFFDKEEIPELYCPAVRNRVHKEKECPLWEKFFFVKNYIDPADLKSVVYHLEFIYNDKITKSHPSLPDGLSIKVYEDNRKEIPSEVVHKKGVYYVKVKFKKIKDPARKEFYFEFEAKDKWVYTKDNKTDPVIVIKSKAEIDALPLPERIKYYDLPARWSSRNYWTRDPSNLNGGGRFEKVFKDDLKLKPFGDNITQNNKTLVFWLDDIVLLDSANGTQELKDCDHGLPADIKYFPLSEKSRIKVFYTDDSTGQLDLYCATNDWKSSRVPFLKEKIGANEVYSNLVSDFFIVNSSPKIIFFRDGFYTVGSKRTIAETDWEKKNYVVGARAAVRNDKDYHAQFPMYYNNTEFGSCGDYDLHYFHAMHLDGKHPVSYAILYVSISFMRDCRDPSKVSPVPSQAEMETYRDVGVYYAMHHWNRKLYILEEDPVKDDCVHIRPFYFFDEREHFNVNHGGMMFDFGERPNHTAMFAHNDLADAQKKAAGGRSKFLAFICKDQDASYHWAVRSEGPKHYSILKLNKSSYLDHGAINEDGIQYEGRTLSHELGHATGRPDEYINKAEGYKPDPNHSYRTYAYRQFLIQYSMTSNVNSLMYHEYVPRLHNLWYYVHRINESAKVANGPLSKMILNKKFRLRFNNGTVDLLFIRKLINGNPNVKPNPATPIHEESLYQVSASPLKRLKLELFDTGKDEASTANFHLNQAPMEYQGVLVIRVMMSVKFTGTWSGANKRVRLDDVEKQIRDLGHFRLVNGKKDLKNIYLYFMSGTTDTWQAAGSCYNIDYQAGNTPQGQHKIQNNSGTLTVYRDANANELARYFVNATAVTVSTIHLVYLKTWVEGKLNDTFTLESF